MEAKAFVDMFRITEDERIKLIVDVLQIKGTVQVMLENEGLDPGKIERYISKVQKLEPRGLVSARAINSPVENVDTLTFNLRDL